MSKRSLRRQGPAPRNLNELQRGEHGVLERLDLPEDDARRLMELGFLPGHTVTPAHSAPGGDPQRVSRGRLRGRAAARDRPANSF